MVSNLLFQRAKKVVSDSPGLVDFAIGLVNSGIVSGRVTRNSQQLNIPLCKTATGQRSFYYRIVSIWKAIRPELKLSQHVNSFKRNLKLDLLNSFLS